MLNFYLEKRNGVYLVIFHESNEPMRASTIEGLLWEENARLREVVKMQTEMLESHEYDAQENGLEFCHTCDSKDDRGHNPGCAYEAAILAGKEVLGK